MVTIPVLVNDGTYSLFIILEDENIERIKAYDPAEVTMSKLPEEWPKRKLKDIVIMYATSGEIANLIKARNPLEVLKQLSRGFKFRPDLGDHDGKYERKN